MKLPKQAQPVVRNTNAVAKADGGSGGVYPSVVDPASVALAMLIIYALER